VVNGDLGVSAGNAVTGFPPGIVVDGTIHAGDAVAAQAQSDLTAAYNALVGQPCGTNLTGQDLGGLTLLAGVYCFSTSAQLTGDLTLSGGPDAVFIFQIGSTLTTASGSSVNLVGGAQSCNVFFQVGSSATLGTATDFTGNVLALTSITAQTGATVDGRLLARNGAVTLDTNRITASGCSGGSGGGGSGGGGSGGDTGTPTGTTTPTGTGDDTTSGGGGGDGGGTGNPPTGDGTGNPPTGGGTGNPPTVGGTGNPPTGGGTGNPPTGAGRTPPTGDGSNPPTTSGSTGDRETLPFTGLDIRHLGLLGGLMLLLGLGIRKLTRTRLTPQV